MSYQLIADIAGGIVIVLLIAFIIYRRHPRKLHQERFTEDWKAIQALCSDKEQWPRVLIDADHLLDKALRLRRMRGRSMGERLVSAQRQFSNNDQVWFAHKLRKKVEESPDTVKLKQSEVRDALIGIRQALKDLGAL